MTDMADLTNATPPLAPVDPPELTLVPGGIPDLEKSLRDLTPPYRLRIPGQWLIDGQYMGWEGVRWGVTFHSLEQVIAFRQALDQFMSSWVTEQGQ
jgi:hypothetical protein